MRQTKQVFDEKKWNNESLNKGGGGGSIFKVTLSILYNHRLLISTTEHLIRVVDCTRFESSCCKLLPHSSTKKLAKFSNMSAWTHGYTWFDKISCPSCRTAVGLLHYGHCSLLLWPHLQFSCLLATGLWHVHAGDQGPWASLVFFESVERSP